MSRLLQDYLEHGLSDIVVIEHRDREDVGGNQNEHTWETVVARRDGKSVRIQAYQVQKFGWATGHSFSIESTQEISPEEYQRLSQGKPVIDTPEVRKEIEDRRAEWLKRQDLKEQLESLAPSCSECRGPMVARDGRCGPFWGCGDYPRCNATQKMSQEQKNIYERWRGKLPL